MKAYIAGKISGDSTYREKFKTAERALSNQGFVVLNPADLPEGMNPADYMRICFAMMESADIVAFLPDYEQSRGAQLEWSWCQYAGKQTMYLESMSFYRDALKEQEPVTDRHQMTNADRIRSMSDEEMARFFIGDSPNYCHPGLCLDGETCIGCFLNWLQQPAEEDDK